MICKVKLLSRKHMGQCQTKLDLNTPDQWAEQVLYLMNSQLSQKSDLMVGSLQQELDQEAQPDSLSGRGSQRRLRGWARTPGGDQLPVRTDLNWSHFKIQRELNTATGPTLSTRVYHKLVRENIITRLF